MSLRERRDILTLANGASDGVLITLVRAAGSSYRQPGARLLALPDSRTAGTISGGCLEADLLRKAQWRVRNGAVMQTYDTGFENDADVPFGLGCGGVVDLLLEPLHGPDGQAILDAIGASLAGQPRTVVTQLPTHSFGSARIVLDVSGDVLYATESLKTEWIVELRTATRKSLKQRGNNEHLFVEEFAPAQRLVLCGAGEDAKPVARLAAQLGWTVVIADGRPQQVSTARFPEAHQLHVTDTLKELDLRQTDVVILMTHSFEQDRNFLEILISLPPNMRPRYIGLLGARHRSALLLRHAAAAARLTLAEATALVHAPIGLELGGEGPEAIALAMIAEVQAVLHRVQTCEGGVLARHMSADEAAKSLERFGNVTLEQPWCALDATPAAERANVLSFPSTRSTTKEVLQ